MIRKPFGGRAVALASVAVLLAAPSAAFGASLSVTNQTPQTASQLNAFQIGDDGNVVEDNIGGYYEAIRTGGTGVLVVTGDCGKVLILADLDNGGELHARVDTCVSQTLILTN